MPRRKFCAAIFLVTCGALAICSPVAGTSGEHKAGVAILSFGESSTAKRVAQTLNGIFREAGPEDARTFRVLDSDQAAAAAAGVNYQGSLNLTLEDARNLAAAIGCNFFLTGEAQTLRRSPSEGPIYFESYASIFLVSGRTGRLMSWLRPSTRRPTFAEAEKALLDQLAGAATIDGFQKDLRRALEDESAQRARAIEAGTPIIEVMSEENAEAQNGVRPPRPFRRFKPEYPAIAAAAEVEAIVDVLVDIDAKGEVERVEIARWAGYGLDQSVVDTVKQLHFFPAMRNGVAIPMRVLLRYNFRKPPK